MKYIRVYKFGIKPPFENREMVYNQLELAHAYRRDLARLERNRRTVRLAVMELDDDFCSARERAQQASQQVTAVYDQIKAVRGAERKLAVPQDLLRALQEKRDLSANALTSFRVQRRITQSRLGFLLERTDKVANDERKILRANCGLFWGTYLLVETAADASAKDTPEFDGHQPNCPGCPPWRGEGSIGVQIQKGMDAACLFGSDTRVRIDPLPRAIEKSGGQPRKAGFGKRQAQRTILRMRIGSTDRKPVWGSWKMSMHRQLPEGARIKFVTVTCRKIGPRQEWTCQITAEIPEPVRACGTGIVAVDIGWRQIGEGLRVGTWWGADGGPAQELQMPADIRSSWDKCDSLRSIRDRQRDVFLPRFHAALSKRELPEWLRTRTATLMRWESCNRIHNLLKEWKERGRFVGDKAAYSMLYGYCYRDYHLWEWEDSQRKKTLRRRKEGYRCIAAKLASTYGTLVLEQFDLRSVAKKPPLVDEHPNETARRNRVIACTSELRECLIQAFVARRGHVVAGPAHNTTKECHITRVVGKFDAAESVRHTTEQGTSWDQDDNACRNLVQRYLERPGDFEIVGGARKSKKTGEIVEMDGGKFNRAKKARAKKGSGEGGAREGGDKAAE